MKTLTEKYRGVLNESYSKKQFVRDARIAHPQLITQFNGFSDTVSILKQKSMISEEDKMPEYSDYANISDEAIRRGTDAELEAMGLMSQDSVSAEDQEKAKEKAIKNIKKDPLHYLNLISGESSKVDKHDKEVEVKKDNHTDNFNGLKKAELKEVKEEAGVPTAFDDKSMDALRDIILKYVEDPDQAEKAVQQVDDNGLDSLAPELLANLDRDEEYKAWYKDLHGMAESNQEESIANFIIKHYTNPKTGKSLIDDEIIGDFFKTHPESKDQEPQAALDNFEEYLSVNYEMPGDYMQEKVAKSVEDVIDPADYGAIGQGYLKGFNRPHSLDLDQLETLGRKVVDSLYKGDFDAAKAKFVGEVMNIDRKGNQKPDTGGSDATKYKAAAKNVGEQMTDQQMADIAKYGQEDKVVSAFKPGDMFSSDFDYEGMLEFGMKVRLNTPIGTLKALYDSFEDVNYHSENSHLGMALDAIEAKDKSEALDHLRNFKKAIKQTLVSFNEGADPSRKNLEEAEVVVTERVGSLGEFIALIQDRAAENDTTEAEEAEEVMYALGEHYNLGVDIMHGTNEGLFDRLKAKASGAMASLGQKGKNFMSFMKGDKDAIKDPAIAKAFAKVSSTAKNLQNQASGVMKDLESLFPKATLDKLPAEAQEAFKQYHATVKAAVDQSATMAQLKEVIGEEYLEEEPNEGNKFEAERLKAIDAGKDHFEVDGKKFPVKGAGSDDKKRAAMAKENIKAIISKVLEEGTINEAATQELAKMTDTYGDFEGMKSVLLQLQDVVTDIESYYDKTRGKIQKAFDSMGEIRNEEGLKVGGFLAPAIESAFIKDLRPVTRQGFTKGLDQPKVRVISKRDIDRHSVGVPNIGSDGDSPLEEKETVYSPPVVNGTLRETKKI